MQKTKLITKVIAGAMLSFFMATCPLVAQPQRPISLLRAKCVNSGLGSARQYDRNISIGKAVYTSRFYIGSGSRSASMTCRIRRSDNLPLFQTLNLGFGMRDNDTSSPPVIVNIYLDGKKVEESWTVAPTQQESVALDVSDATNVSIETVCSSKSEYCDRVYFYNASLEQRILSPSTSN